MAAQTGLGLVVLVRGDEREQDREGRLAELPVLVSGVPPLLPPGPQLVLPLYSGVPPLLPPGPQLVLPLYKPPEPLLRVQLSPARQHGDGWRQHDGDRVGVVGVGADLGVLGGDLIDVEIVVVVVSE